MRTMQEVNKIIEELCVNMASLFPQDQIEAILFGSYARGDAEPGSDIDVLILVDASRQDISARNWQVGDLAAEFLLNYGIVVSPIVENREYFNRNVNVLPFYRNVNREGVREKCLISQGSTCPGTVCRKHGKCWPPPSGIWMRRTMLLPITGHTTPFFTL